MSTRLSKYTKSWVSKPKFNQNSISEVVTPIFPLGKRHGITYDVISLHMSLLSKMTSFNVFQYEISNGMSYY